MKKSFRIASKYLIERSHFFSRSQLVLTLLENYLQMQPLSSDREEKEGGIIRIDWDCILNITASDRNPKEFTIAALPPNKKKQGGQINKANAQQLIFSCKERNRLLTELIHKLHVMNGEKAYLIEKALHQTDIFKEGSKKKVSLRLHPTVIQVIVKSVQPYKRLGGKFAGVGGGSSLRQNSQKRDHKKNDSNLFEESQSESGEPLFEQFDPIEFNEDEDDEEDLEAYETDGQGLNGTILTPYKGSMIGGTVIGEDQVVGANQLEQIDTVITKQHFIYLCDIERVFTYQDSLIIVKKNQEIDKFILRTENRAKEFSNWIKKNCKENYKTNLIHQNIQTFDYEKIFDDLEFLNRSTQPVYSQQVKAYTWDGIVSGLQIELDENYVYEVDKTLDKIRKKCLLRDLVMIRVDDRNQNYNLVLIFQNETEMVLQLPTLADREKIVSTILTLRNLVIPSSGFVDQLTVLCNSQIDFSQKIYGLDPQENSQYIQDYEALIFRKLSENISYKDTMKINNLIEEALMNTSFANLIKIEQKNVKVIIKEINQTLQTYLYFECCEQGIIEAYLKKSNLDHIIDFYGYKKRTTTSQIPQQPSASQTQQDMQDLSQIQPYNEDAQEKMKQFESLYERIAKYLNILNLFLNSKAILTDIQEEDELIHHLIKLLISKSPYLSLLASQVLRQAIQHFSGNESKLEQINKKLMIRGKVNQVATNQHTPIQEQQANQSINYQLLDIGDPILLMQAMKEYLQYFEHLYDSFGIIKSLHLYSLGNILRSFLVTRRQSTAREELKVFADMIVEDDIKYTELILEEEKHKNQGQLQNKKQKSNKLEDPLKNKPMFHLVDKFSLLGQDNFDIQYMFTTILNETLQYYKRYETDRLQNIQQYLLTYSIQFVWQLYQQMESQLKEQKRLSIYTLSKILFQNQDAVSLLLRCFPKILTEKVDTHINLQQSLSWNDQEWEEFFSKITYKLYDTATEQWNEETRQELKSRLQKELQDFIEAKRLHIQVMQDENRRELILPNHEFNRNKRVISRSINLKWNYMEFCVKYISLNTKYLVWKYYLTKLLVESNLQETQKPYFTQKIQKPAIFWQELKIKFMSSFDPQEQIIILKTMIVLYNTEYKQLKDLKTIPYLLKLFDQQQYEHCHFILMQLMHVALSVEREFAIKNMKKFIKGNGLNILLNQMKLVFKELLRADRGKQIEQNPQLLVISTFSRDKYEKYLYGEGTLKDFANYTNSNTNSRYFKRNSEYVCMGILALKILDLIFKEMCAIDYVPLPINREFLLRSNSLATLTQLFMIENVDLTREITIFIQMHMNNHYSFFKMKNLGVIEYLILNLSSRNGDRALEILQKFQEVCFDYNDQIKMGLLNSNDLKMLQDDREKVYKNQYIHTEEPNQQQASELAAKEKQKYTILEDSIFLRYLPISLIKFLYEEGQQRFLEVYKMNFYESSILIWNSKLRTILEDQIRANSLEFIEELKEYASQSAVTLKTQDTMPCYTKKFTDIVKYSDIESEVRCGRYYLRVWVNQKKRDPDFFDIPREEEDEFHKNLRNELRYCVQEENFRDQEKIIILFKACLLALQRFHTKRIVSLDEIKKILNDTCKNQQYNNPTVKQMVYIGIKIINQVVKYQSEYYLKNSKQNPDTIRDVIKAKNLSEIFNLILKNSFQQNNEQTLTLAEQYQSITLNRIEAKTLSLCIQSLNIILNNNIQAFVDFPLTNRIKLFKQISRLLDVSFNLIPLFKDRALANHIFQFDSRTYSSYQQPQQVQSPKGKSQKRKSKSRKNKSKNKGQKNQTQQQMPIQIIRKMKAQKSNQQASLTGQQSWQIINLTNNNQSSHNPQLGSVMFKPTQNQLIQELDKYNLSKQKPTKERKIRKKDPNIDYVTRSLLQIINEHMDKHSIELIFNITRSIFELTREITKNPVLHPELIASGMAWKSLKYIYLSLKEETSEFQDLRASLREATITLKNLISFAHQLEISGAESFTFKNLTKDEENKIMKNFWTCIQCIFCNKFQETLISQFVISNNELLFASYDPRKFLSLFSLKEEYSPELVWNNETRQELLEALDAQIINLQKSFYDHLSQFQYSVNQRELRVEDIFVRHFNNQNEFKPADLDNFAQKLLDKLREIMDFKYLENQKYIADLTQEEIMNCNELVKALKILLINENLIINDQEKFDDYLSTFCNMIQIKPDFEGSLDPSPEEIEMLKGISFLILDLILQISKNGGLHFDYLKNNNDFIRLLIRSLYSKEKEVTDSNIIIAIIQNILSVKEVDISQFLISTGLIMFILNQIFEKKPQNINKKERVELIKLILQASPYTQGIYSKYIPQYFFVEIQSKQLNDLDTEKIIEFIKELDSSDFENVFIIWNSALKNENHQRIKNNCEQIMRSYEDSRFQVQLDLYELQKDEIQLDEALGRETLQMQPVAQKKFKALCNRTLVLLTSLLLSIEQLLLNDYNPNRLMANKKDDKNVETKFYKQIIEKTTDQTQLDHKVYQILGIWLQNQVFMGKHIPVEIRVTFLQLIFLVIDVQDAIKVLKDNQSLMQFITESIGNIYSDKFSKTIEEALVLLITQKMLRKDSEPTPVLITNSLQKLFKIYEKKKKLKKLVEFILALMARRHENSEHTEAIMRIWRGKPSSSSDAKNFYHIDECNHIEDKIEETNIPKMKLPILSKKSAKQYQKEELFYEEEKDKKKETAKNIKAANDMPFLATKENKLGYQPILQDVQEFGATDLEAIEKHEEPFIEDDDLEP